MRTALLRLVPLLTLLLLTACDDARQGYEDARSGDLELASPPDAVMAAIDSVTVRNHIITLSDDAMEGRATGTGGEQRAIEYIAAQMEAAGLVPAGDNGTFFQPVPLLGATPTITEPLTFTAEDGTTERLTLGDDYTASTDLAEASVAVEGDLVFVGYGVNAPAANWNDYKDLDLTDKILVAFVNDPPASETEPELFQGDTLTYYGRWTYKFEEARRQGARGALLIHTPEMAGYPFAVVAGGAANEQVQLATPPENPLAFRGWISQETAERLAEMAGTSLDAWFEAAASRDFQPQELPVDASVAVDYALREFEGTNVVGKIQGTAQPEEGIVYTAHHDHLGIGQPDETGDTIYNGALDNASGVAQLLAAAEAFGSAPEPPQRSVVFLSLSAEESGLLGSTHYTRFPHIAMDRTIANINLDGGNVYGETRDIVGLGAEKSELGDLFGAAAALENLSVVPDPNPEQGFFFRSDQLPFAREGVPAVFLNPGTDYIGQPADYAEEVFADYNAERYHRQGDEFDETWPMGGLQQQARVAVRLGYDLAYSDRRPAWNPGEAFAQARGE